MKMIVYFAIAILSLVYLAVLCFLNVTPNVETLGGWGKLLEFIGNYGGVIIIFVFAFFNFLGNPLKIVFFVLLILLGIVYILTIFVPKIFA